MIDKLIGWLGSNPRRLSAIERDFVAQLDDGHPDPGPRRPAGDRRGRPARGDRPEDRQDRAARRRHRASIRQLGAYQAAVEAGAFDDVGSISGGAALVQLGASAATAKEQRQPPISPTADDPTWAAELVRAYGADDGRFDVPRRRELALPQLPGATRVPDHRQGSPGHRRW